MEFSPQMCRCMQQYKRLNLAVQASSVSLMSWWWRNPIMWKTGRGQNIVPHTFLQDGFLNTSSRGARSTWEIFSQMGEHSPNWENIFANLCCVFILKKWHYRPQTPICNRLLCLIDRSSNAWNRWLGSPGSEFGLFINRVRIRVRVRVGFRVGFCK